MSKNFLIFWSWSSLEYMTQLGICVFSTFVKPTITGILNLMAPALLKIAPELLGYNNLHRVANEFHEMLQEIIDEHKRTLPPEDQPRDFIDAYLHEINRTHAIDSSFYKETGSELFGC